jgi:DNA-binding NarL/FixJ family response regulator
VAQTAALRILVVEDEALVAMTIEALLSDAGFEVLACVDTGAAAVEACERLRPQVAVMDINLRGPMDGCEAAAIIRRTCGASVVFLTGQGDAATRKRACALDPAAYLVKPFLADELVAAVSSAGNGRSLAAHGG